MGMLLALLGILGALCGVMGILTGIGVAPSFLVVNPSATWMFWFALCGVLLIGCIAVAVARGGYE